MIEPLFYNLEKRDTLSEEEKDVLRSLVIRQKECAAGQDIVREGSSPKISTILIDGFAARYKLTAEGARQFTSLQISGDFIDLHAFILKKMDHGILALSTCEIATVDHQHLTMLTVEYPHLMRLLWMDTLIDVSIAREWIVAMGRRSRAAHLAHIICELYVRLEVVQQTSGWSFFLPLSQAQLADVLGLSLVHVNRIVQTLRKDGLITWASQTVTILDWERLCSLAEFEPTYLSLKREPR